MELTLTTAERELLLEILEEHHRELLREIARAHHHQFKMTLRTNERLLESTLTKLKVAQPPGLAVA